MPSFERARPRTVLAAFLALHAAVWTLVPSIVNPNLPLDAIEVLAWGHAWQWGYDKHPPLSPWLAELAYGLAPGQDWPLYLLSALCVTLALWAVWRLARDILAPRAALVAVLALEGVYYHNFTSPEFNANVVLLPCWALSALFLWRALTRGSLIAWGLFGLFGALGLLGKYFTGFLILAMGLFLLTDRDSRAVWRTPGPYLALGVALIVLAPHLAWMLSHDFQTIAYALARSGALSESAFVRHAVQPGEFLLAQALASLPMLLLLLALGRPRRGEGQTPRERRFLLIVGLAPLVLVVLVSVVFGLRLRSMWGTPLFLFSGLLAVAYLEPNGWNLRRFALVWAGLFLLAPVSYAGLALAQPYLTSSGKRVHFPGRVLAREVDSVWRMRFGGPLEIVIGSEWVAGNVAAYGAARPQAYIDADPVRAPWLDDTRVRARGAAVVWELRPGVTQAGPPFSLARRFSCLEPHPPVTLSWDTGANLPPLRFGLALIAPAAACEQP